MAQKYNNKALTVDGLRFDSMAEYRRWQELTLLEKTGHIAGLTHHPRYEIVPCYTRQDGTKVRAVHYEADSEYVEGSQTIIEDVKGFETQSFKLKRKLLEAKYFRSVFRLINAKDYS